MENFNFVGFGREMEILICWFWKDIKVLTTKKEIFTFQIFENLTKSNGSEAIVVFENHQNGPPRELVWNREIRI